MYYVQRTDEFDVWLAQLKDLKARARILVRIRSAELGNLGEVVPIGKGLSEMRVHYGPGYRVWFRKKGRTLFLVLCGGSKKTQKRDIEKAKLLARKYEDV